MKKQFRVHGTDAELARVAKVSPAQLSDWRNNIRLPSFAGLLKLSQGEDRDVFEYTLSEFGCKASLKLLLNSYAFLSDEARAAVDEAITELVQVI